MVLLEHNSYTWDFHRQKIRLLKSHCRVSEQYQNRNPLLPYKGKMKLSDWSNRTLIHKRVLRGHFMFSLKLSVCSRVLLLGQQLNQLHNSLFSINQIHRKCKSKIPFLIRLKWNWSLLIYALPPLSKEQREKRTSACIFSNRQIEIS